MNTRNRTVWNIFLISCVFTYLATGIVTVQDDTEKKSVVWAENSSVSIEDEGKSDFNDKVMSDKLDLNSENANVNSNDNVREEAMGQPVYADAASQNAGVLNDVTTGGSPVVVSLPETATLELKAKVEELSASVAASQLESHENRTKAAPETHEEAPSDISLELEQPKNDTVISQNKSTETPEEIPSFSEWAQKRLEEAEKNEEVLNESSQHHTGKSNTGSNGKSGSGVKLGWKNYASPDCGAKVVAANQEAVSPSSVISPSREEYKLNVCTNRIWFIVELCEAIQARKIDIANFELFSSTPKDFTVSIGDRFPNREWTTVGQFTARDVRDVQSFDLDPYLFGRYIKVEVKSHHGTQHYCPISLFRVYGISELEVLQKEELTHSDEDDDEDDDESSSIYSEDLTKNMLNSATNAVYSMIKKAAEVLGTKSNHTEEKSVDKVIKLQYSPLINTCSTPSHRVVCVNCSDLLFGQIYEILSCKSSHIQNLINVPFIRRSLINSNICRDFGLDSNVIGDRSAYNRSSRSVRLFFPNKFLGAMCNSLAVSENKAVLNISQQFPNITKTFNVSDENLANIETSGLNLKIEQSIDIPIPDSNSEIRPTDELMFDSTNKLDLPKATCSTDLSYSSQIKPTKTVVLDVLVEPSNIPIESETDLLGQVTKTETPPSEDKTDNEEKKVAESELKVDDNLQAIDASGQIEITTESSENIDQIENFMTDMNGENGPSTVPSVPVNNNPADRQKESVFLRLSNRIKALERNVSLSSQYLEELSRRYKKQVEEMQKLLEKTLQSLTEERNRADLRNKELEERLDHLMMIIGKWPGFLFWLLFTLAATCGILWMCGSKGQRNEIVSSDIERRKSVDVIPSREKKPKIRRPSDQAMKIVRSSLVSEERKLSREKRKRKRSNREIKRSNSATGLGSDDSKVRDNVTTQHLSGKYLSPCWATERVQDLLPGGDISSPNNPGDWVEENRRLLEIIPLDESEHSSLEPFSTIMEQDVPQYTQTAVDRRAHRLSSQHNRSNANGNYELYANVPRKSGSLDESYRFKNKLTRRSSLNSSLDESGRKKEKRSFKSVLKNVFT